MSHRVLLRRESDKSVKEVEISSEWDEVEYLWLEGNYACDCNRHLHFNDFDGTHHPCGDDAYMIVGVIESTGRLVDIGEV